MMTMFVGEAKITEEKRLCMQTRPGPKSRYSAKRALAFPAEKSLADYSIFFDRSRRLRV